METHSPTTACGSSVTASLEEDIGGNDLEKKTQPNHLVHLREMFRGQMEKNRVKKKSHQYVVGDFF